LIYSNVFLVFFFPFFFFSLINALTGKKVVSVSRQPGHTKIMQPLKINDHTVLCDCPGLIFPAVDVPRPLQVLAGIYPIPQTRELYSAVQYLAERVPLEDVLGLTPPETAAAAAAAGGAAAAAFKWSAWLICERYAAKRGFESGYGRLDANRAAQAILYAVADGHIPFYFTPPADTK
jgi:ribosome biogenesis GTPase A